MTGRSFTRLLTVSLGLAVLLFHTAADAASEYERIREKAEELAVAINNAKAGPLSEGKDSEMEKAYGGYGYLLTPTKLEKMDQLVAEAATEEEKALRAKTAAFLHYHAIRSRVAPVVDNCIDSWRDNTIAVEGGKVTLLGLDHRMGLEENRDMRRNWWLAASELYSRINIFRLNLLLDLDTEAKKLGYAGYYDFLRRVEGWDIDQLKATAEVLLTDTHDAYEAQLTALAEEELDLELRKIRTYDAPRLHLLPGISSQVKRYDPLDVATATLEKMGLQLKKQQMLKVDVRKKDGRAPEAHAFPDRKGKALVTMIPSGYIADLPDLLGALGEAEFTYLIPAETRFEDAYFGTNILPSVYRALMEMVVEEPAWVSKHLKLDGATPEEVASMFRFRRLFKVREAAGKLLFQRKLHENLRLDPDVYETVMGDAMLWRRTANDADAYLSSNDDYRSGGLLVGYAIAAQIIDGLRTEWGEEWFRNEQMATRLQQGAAEGLAMPLDEFMGIWGVPSLDTGILVTQLTAQAQ